MRICMHHGTAMLKNKLKIETEKQKTVLADIISRNMHLLFHFYETQHCCMCGSKKTTPPRRNIHLTKQQWNKLFTYIAGKCHNRRTKGDACCCNYRVNPTLNVDSLDSNLVSTLLLCLFHLSQNEIQAIQILMMTAELLHIGQDYSSSEAKAIDNNENAYASLSCVDEHLKKIDGFDFFSEKNATQQMLTLIGEVIAFQSKISLRLNTIEDKIQKSKNTKRDLEDSPGPSGSTLKRQKRLTGELGGRIASDTPTTEPVLSGVGKIQSFYYSYDSFPRFHYKQKLVKHCANRVTSLHSVQDEFIILSSEILKIDVTGDIKSSYLRLISKRKALHNPQQRIGLTDLLVYFKTSSLSWSSVFQDIANIHYKDIVMVREVEDEPNIPSVHPCIHHVKYEKERIRETLTLCLESQLSLCVDKLRKKLESVRQSRQNAGSLERFRSEVSALSSMIAESNANHDLESMKKGKCKSSKQRIPSQVKDYLFKRKNVHSFGIWRGGCFKIFVDEKEKTTQLKSELRKLHETFFENFDLKVEIIGKSDWNFGNCPHIGQGDKLWQEIGKQQGHGTLGGFVKNSANKEQIFALTCSHVCPSEGDIAFTEMNSEISREKIGTCYFSQKTGPTTFCDFALIEIDEGVKEKCAIVLTDENEIKRKAVIFREEIPENLFVHKKGAKTAWTCGFILSPEFYINAFGDRKEVFLVSNRAIESPFSKGGDSGSIVFSHDNTTMQTSINILGMILGGDTSDREEEGEEENLQQGACSSKSSFGESKGNKDHRLKDASVCFRIDDAFQILQQKRGTSVEFDKVSSSSSDESDESDS